MGHVAHGIVAAVVHVAGGWTDEGECGRGLNGL
jgi:hypothetical protein